MDVVENSLQAGGALPPDPPKSSWKSWVLGGIVMIGMPFLKKKWDELLKLKEEVDTAVEAAEHEAGVVEKVADEVEKVADEVSDELPNHKFKQVATFVESAAKETAKDAHLVEPAIDKVQKVEKDVQTVIQSNAM